MSYLFSFIARALCPNYSDYAKSYWHYREQILNKKTPRIIRGYLEFRAKKIAHKFGALVPICDNISPFDTPHGLLGIVINKDAVIGNGCVIFHQVTNGKNDSSSKHFGAPVIGNNVIIGAGAKIIGDVSVGDNVKIGANCVVVESIPSSCTVVMDKPRIIEKFN